MQWGLALTIVFNYILAITQQKGVLAYIGGANIPIMNYIPNGSILVSARPSVEISLLLVQNIIF